MDDTVLGHGTLCLEHQGVDRVDTRGDIVRHSDALSINATRSGRVRASRLTLVNGVAFVESLNLDISGRLGGERILKLLESQHEVERAFRWVSATEDIIDLDNVARLHGACCSQEVVPGIALRLDLHR